MLSMSSKKFLSEFIRGLFNKNSVEQTNENFPVRPASTTPSSNQNFPVRPASLPLAEESPPVFEEVLKEAESSNNYQAVNPQGYMGAFQFGEARLQDFKDAKDKDFSKEEFLKNKELQNEVFDWHTNDIKKYIKDRKLDKFIGQEIQGNTVTMDGLVAVAHLGGKFGMRKFLETNGEYNPRDSNEVKLSDYLVRFGNSEMGRLGFRFGGGADAGAGSLSGDRGFGAGVSKDVRDRIGNKERQKDKNTGKFDSTPKAGPNTVVGNPGEQQRQYESELKRLEKIQKEAEERYQKQLQTDNRLKLEFLLRRKERRDRSAGSNTTPSNAPSGFGPLFDSSYLGHGVYLDPNSSIYNPKYFETYGFSGSNLNMAEQAEITKKGVQEDKFTGETSIIDDIKDTVSSLTTFDTPVGELKIKPSTSELKATLSFKKGGLLDRSSKK